MEGEGRGGERGEGRGGEERGEGRREGKGGEERAHHKLTWWLLPTVKHALLALHVEWCGEGGTHFLVELALRSSVATSLRERDAAGVWGYHAEVGHVHPVTRGVSPTGVELEGWGQGRVGPGRGGVRVESASQNIQMWSLLLC